MKAALLALLAAGCAPLLTAESAAPPGRVARLDDVTNFWGIVKSYKLELSQGVAIAFTCNHGGPCQHMKVTPDDPNVADVRPASLGTLHPSGFNGSQATAAAAVIVGKKVGATHVWVKTPDGDRDIAVSIVAAPEPATTKATVSSR